MTSAFFPACALALVAGVAAAEPLPRLTLAPEATTVSGLSSGAFMSVQLQTAFSASIAGAGIVAGGQYDCADHLLWRALNVCMSPLFVSPEAESAVETIKAFAAADRIDPPEHIAADRLYLFHGEADDTVARATMDALQQSYALLGVSAENLSYVTTVDAGHGFVTERGTLSCDLTEPDFLIDCDFDQAGDILSQLYGPLAPAVAPRPEGFLTVDQGLYTEGARGMDDTAFLYVPESCASGTLCRLHIALHGCKQGRQVIGEAYARQTGYNGWAEANDIVVLYPQAVKRPWYYGLSANPNGCWDWWGYSGPDYLTRSAPQLAAIARMAEALGAPL